jgi:hypothetical protein
MNNYNVANLLDEKASSLDQVNAVFDMVARLQTRMETE